MLNRKWLIDNQGHLAGIWNDCDLPRTVPVYLTEKPQPRIVHVTAPDQITNGGTL
jgi:hypothetical protein